MKVVPLDVGCQPSPSGAREVVVASQSSTLVMFMAIDTRTGEGLLEDKKVAIVECVNCRQSRQGYPNDEGRQEHPLWKAGLSQFFGICEVRESQWAAAVQKQIDDSARRIWGPHYEQAYQRGSGLRAGRPRHFIFMFKETTFECLASELSLTLYEGSYEEALQTMVAKAYPSPQPRPRSP
ncbi:MAG TPA: hypothetical protein VJM11_14945 [Nevskiaceae bacterium]|nr:hypothetical protein [Nevskiaceae bacterium]